MDSSLSITGVILAGGRSSRMGGQDKGLLKLRGRPLIAYVIQAIAPQVDHLLISANRNLDRYRDFGHPVLSDPVPDFAGPLAGILAALQQTETAYLLSVPCDGPWLPTELRQRLQAALQRTDAEIACVHDGRRLHPVYALLRQELQPDLAAYLAGGGRAVQQWFRSRRLVEVDFSDRADCFANLNTIQAMQQAAERITSPNG